MEARQMLTRVSDAVAACNRGDLDRAMAAVAYDVIWRDVVLGVLHGRDALQDATKAYMSAFPDLRIEETSTTLAPPRLALELTVTGTHRGELLGVPATGRWTENYVAVVVTFDDDGLMIEGTLYWNPLAIMEQLGIDTGFAAAPA
jgi:C-1 hydroxylase